MVFVFFFYFLFLFVYCRIIYLQMEYEPIIDIVEDIFGEHRRHNEYKGQISYDCPVCSYDIKILY